MSTFPFVLKFDALKQEVVMKECADCKGKPVLFHFLKINETDRVFPEELSKWIRCSSRVRRYLERVETGWKRELRKQGDKREDYCRRESLGKLVLLLFKVDRPCLPTNRADSSSKDTSVR